MAQGVFTNAQQAGEIEVRCTPRKCPYPRYELIPEEEKKFYTSHYSELAGME